jgi:hypothetical protein
MPQISSTTSVPNYDTSSFYAECNALQSAIIPGNKDTAQNWERLRSLLNTWVGHTHSVQDIAFQVLAGGNTPTYPTDQIVTTSTNTSGLPGEGHSEASGNRITAAWVNALIANINNIRTHAHSVTDETLP